MVTIRDTFAYHTEFLNKYLQTKEILKFQNFTEGFRYLVKRIYLVLYYMIFFTFLL